MKITVKDCYELEGDYQNQFLGKEVLPKPKYKKLNLSERSAHKVHYEDIYILEPLHYYYIEFNEDIYKNIKVHSSFSENGLLHEMDLDKKRLYLFNATQNIIYLQKGTVVGELIIDG